MNSVSGARGGAITVTVSAVPNGDCYGYTGGSGSITYDHNALTLTGYRMVGEIVALNGGNGPDFQFDKTYPEDQTGTDYGITFAWVGSFVDINAAAVQGPLVELDFTIKSDAPGSSTEVAFADQRFGSPPVDIALGTSGLTNHANIANGVNSMVTITGNAQPGARTREAESPASVATYSAGVWAAATLLLFLA
jgi:hypothetical protein